MTTATLTQARPERAQVTRKGPERPTPRPQAPRVSQQEVEGRFRPISTMQLLMAFWACREAKVGWRALRVYFAAHEVTERRRWAQKDSADWRPLYRVEEIQKLVGEGSVAQISADIRKLGRLGLVKIERHKISFATSIEQILLDDVSGFWAMWRELANKNRTVPVPRRTLRALAAGFTPAQTATILGLLIRSVFWHKKSGYNTDGRTKRSWIANVFGISLRSVTEARAHLICIGWLTPEQDTPQWLLNKYGAHDVVNVDWAPSKVVDNSSTSSMGEGSGAPKSASPSPRFERKSASPDLTGLLSLTRRLKNQKAQGRAPSPAGFSIEGSKRRTPRPRRAARPAGSPNIRDIQAEDFQDIERLLELQSQATANGLWQRGEGSQLEFLAMAEHAWAKGDRFGALFMALLQKQRFAFVTNADEDRARKRLREHRDQEFEQNEQERGGTYALGDLIQPSRDPGTSRRAPERRLSPDEEIVEKCIRLSKDRRVGMPDPFHIARKVKSWTRNQWDVAHASYTVTQARQWCTDEELCV